MKTIKVENLTESTPVGAGYYDNGHPGVQIVVVQDEETGEYFSYLQGVENGLGFETDDLGPFETASEAEAEAREFYEETK